MENPRKWRNVVATVGLASRASEKCWGELFEEINEPLNFAPADLDQVKGHHLHLVAENSHMCHLLGKLCRAVKVAGGEAAFPGRTGPSPFVGREWDALRRTSAVSAESASAS